MDSAIQLLNNRDQEFKALAAFKQQEKGEKSKTVLIKKL